MRPRESLAKFNTGTPSAVPTNRHSAASCRQWWVFHKDHGAYAARRVHWQTICDDQAANRVLVRLASFRHAQTGFIDPASRPACRAVAVFLMSMG